MRWAETVLSATETHPMLAPKTLIAAASRAPAWGAWRLGVDRAARGSPCVNGPPAA